MNGFDAKNGRSHKNKPLIVLLLLTTLKLIPDVQYLAANFFH